MERTVVLDDREWKQYLSKMLIDLRNPIEKLRTLACTMGYANIIEHFREERGADGRWVKRSETTQRRYARLHKKSKVYNPSNRLLQLTGTLRKNILVGKDTKRSEIVGTKAVRLYSNVPYAGVHNYGYKKIPKREFMWLDKVTCQKMANGLLEWLTWQRSK